MAVLTAHQHNGGGLERRMEVAKAKLESFKESSTLRKIEEFLKAARLGRANSQRLDKSRRNFHGPRWPWEGHRKRRIALTRIEAAQPSKCAGFSVAQEG